MDDDPLVPERFDRHTIIFLFRPVDATPYSDEELDRLQSSTSRTCVG
jgi:hypothetical protein